MEAVIIFDWTAGADGPPATRPNSDTGTVAQWIPNSARCLHRGDEANLDLVRSVALSLRAKRE